MWNLFLVEKNWEIFVLLKNRGSSWYFFENFFGMCYIDVCVLIRRYFFEFR